MKPHEEITKTDSDLISFNTAVNFAYDVSTSFENKWTHISFLTWSVFNAFHTASLLLSVPEKTSEGLITLLLVLHTPLEWGCIGEWYVSIADILIAVIKWLVFLSTSTN